MYLTQVNEARPGESARLLRSTYDAAYESSPFVYGLQMCNFFRHFSDTSRNMRTKYIKHKISEDAIKGYVSFVSVKARLSTVTCESHTGFLQILRPRIIAKWVERRKFKWKKRFYKECKMHERSGGRSWAPLLLHQLPREFPLRKSFGYTEVVKYQPKPDEMAPHISPSSRIGSYLPWPMPSQTTPPRSRLPLATPPRATPPLATPAQATPPQATPAQATPPKATPPQATPPQATPPEATPHQATPLQAMSPGSTPPRATPLRASPPRATPPQAMSTRCTPPWATLPSGTPPQATPLRATPPRATPPQGTLSRAKAPRTSPPRATPPRATPPWATSPQSTSPRVTSPRATSPRATAPRTTPPRAMPLRATPTRATPRASPPRASPPRASPPRTSPPRASPPWSSSPRATPPRATPLRATPPRVMLPRATPPRVTPPGATPPSATMPRVTPPRATLPRATPPRATPPRATPPQGTQTWASSRRARLPRATPPQGSPDRATPPRTTLPRATLPRATPPRATPPRATWPRVTLSSSSLPRVTPLQSTPPQGTLTRATLPRVTPPPATLPLWANPLASQQDMGAGGQLRPPGAPPPPARCGERLAPVRLLPRVQQAVVRLKDTFQHAQRRTEYVPPEFCLYTCAGHFPSEEDLNDDTLHSFGPASEQRRTWSVMRRSWAEVEGREEQQNAEEKQMLDKAPKQIYRIKDDIYLRDFPSDGRRRLLRGARAEPLPGSRCLLARDFGHRLLVMEFEFDSWTPAPTYGTNVENYFQGTVKEQIIRLKHLINTSVIDFKGKLKDLSTHAESISDKWFCFKPNFDKSSNVEEEKITKSSIVNFKTDEPEKGNSNRDIEDPDKITTSTTNNSRCIVSTGLKRHICCPPLHTVNSSQTLAVKINTKETSGIVRDLDSNIKNSCVATVFIKEFSAQTETYMAETIPVTLKRKEPAITYIPVTLSNNYDDSITANKFSDIGTGYPKLPRNPRRNTVELNTCDIRPSKSYEIAVVGVRALAKSTINGANVFLSDVGTCTAKLPRNPKIASDEYNFYYTIVDSQRPIEYINIEKARSTSTVSVGLDPTTEITRITDDGKKNKNLHSALDVLSYNATKRTLIFSDVGISTTKLLCNPKQDTVECNTSFTTTRAVVGTLTSSDINNGIFKHSRILIKSASLNKESGIKGNFGLTADFKVSSKKTEAYRSASHVYLSTTNSNRSTAKNNELIADAEIETDQFINGSTTTLSDATFIKPVCHHDSHITKCYITAKDIKKRKITKNKDDHGGNYKMFCGSAVITNRSKGKIAIEEKDIALINLTDNATRAKMFSDVGISTSKLLHYPKQIQVSCQKISRKSYCVIKFCRVSGIAKSIKLNGKLVQMNIELADFKRSSKKTDASSCTPYVFISTACGNSFTATNDNDAEIAKNQYAMTLTNQTFCKIMSVDKLTKDSLQNLKRNSDMQRDTKKHTTFAPKAATNVAITRSEADKSTDDEKCVNNYCQGDSETGIRYRF